MSRLGRLKVRPEFLRVAAQGRKWSMPGLVLQAGPRPLDGSRVDGDQAKNEPSDEIRVGFTVTRKVGGAVVRNRARRRLRAAAAEVLPEVGLPGMDYVVIGRQGTLKRPYALLKQDLAEAAKRLARQREAGQ